MTPKSAIKVLSFMAIVVGALCYVGVVPPEMAKSKDHEGHCYHEESNTLIMSGNSETVKTCEQITCNDDFSMTVEGCAPVERNDPTCLKWERDFSKNYPDCCYEFTCVELAPVPAE